jgi:hypothetical protein
VIVQPATIEENTLVIAAISGDINGQVTTADLAAVTGNWQATSAAASGASQSPMTAGSLLDERFLTALAIDQQQKDDDNQDDELENDLALAALYDDVA